MLKTLKLDGVLTKAGYAIEAFGNSCDFSQVVAISDDVNLHLQGNRISLFEIPNDLDQTFQEQPEIADYISSHPIFNGQLLGLRDEIVPGCNHLCVSEARYFDSLGSNDIAHVLGGVFAQLIEAGKMPGFIGSCLVSEKLNALPNIMGVSTIAVTSDGFLVLNRQSSCSSANAGRIAPSGSGSVDYADYLELTDSLDTVCLDDVLIKAAERELKEESCIGDVGIETRLIGHFKLISRGGKGDFMCVSRLDCTKSDIEKRILSCKLDPYSSVPVFYAIGDDPVDGICECISSFDEKDVSVQLLALPRLLVLS